MKEIILLKYGEIALKGMNKSSFEGMLIKNIRKSLKKIGDVKITKAQSTIYVEPISDDVDYDDITDALIKVFGIAALTRCAVAEKEFDDISVKAVEYLKNQLLNVKTFKVTAKRSDKHFPMKSPEICNELGGIILNKFPHLSVDVHNPDITITVEVRDFAAYIHANQIKGAGGMPVGSSGNALLLLSGGIDSPVAAHMMAKRGLKLSAIHFVSPPYTGEFAKQKVVTLCEKLMPYTGNIQLYIIHFTEIQEAIRDNCPEDFFTIIMRRYMMKIAARIAEQNDMDALITGESLAQVASQTLKAIACTDIAVDLPVFRPVIGMDKNEIVVIARKIDTFETSILPYEDCCTVFTPKHPRTRPKLDQILKAEACLDEEKLIDNAIKGSDLQ